MEDCTFCPNCDSERIEFNDYDDDGLSQYICTDCGAEFECAEEMSEDG